MLFFVRAQGTILQSAKRTAPLKRTFGLCVPLCLTAEKNGDNINKKAAPPASCGRGLPENG